MQAAGQYFIIERKQPVSSAAIIDAMECFTVCSLNFDLTYFGKNFEILALSPGKITSTPQHSTSYATGMDTTQI